MSRTTTVFDVLTSQVELDLNQNRLTIINELDAKLYSRVKSLLNRLGGVWQAGKNYFQFGKKPIDQLIERALECGSRKLNKFSFYPTPKSVFQSMVQFTSLSYLGYSGKIRILEPSCGDGGLIKCLLNHAKENGLDFEIDGIEIDPLNQLLASQIESKGDIRLGNFLDREPQAIYDSVIMNPPFETTGYIKHIQHAQKFLKPGGVLISVVPTAFISKWNESPRFKWLLERAQYSAGSLLSNGDFHEAGTFDNVSIPTTIIEISDEESYQAQLNETNRKIAFDNWRIALESDAKIYSRWFSSEILNSSRSQLVSFLYHRLNLINQQYANNLLPVFYLKDFIDDFVNRSFPSLIVQSLEPANSTVACDNRKDTQNKLQVGDAIRVSTSAEEIGQTKSSTGLLFELDPTHSAKPKRPKRRREKQDHNQNFNAINKTPVNLDLFGDSLNQLPLLG